MQEDRAPWWFFLPILLLVCGLVPAAAVQNLLDRQPSPAVDSVPRDALPDVAREPGGAILHAAVESGSQHSHLRFQSQDRLLAAGIADVALAILLRQLLPLPADPGRGSVLFQFHTLSLQL